jgi:phosphoglycolate phosphatase-like HAD superfamily hydrolase
VTRVILFDIDGTLVLTGGAGLRSMARAFEEMFDVANAFDGQAMSGRTDSAILSDAVASHGVPCDASDRRRFRDVYLTYLRGALHEPGPRKGVLPGIVPLLDALRGRDDTYLALLTGNYEDAARAKLEYFDLWKYFSGGAFGDDAPDRHALFTRAVADIGGRGGPMVTPKDVVVVGDTPLDVECAVVAGAQSLAVATGSYDVDALRAAGANIVMVDLSDTAAVLRALSDD